MVNIQLTGFGANVGRIGSTEGSVTFTTPRSHSTFSIQANAISKKSSIGSKKSSTGPTTRRCAVKNALTAQPVMYSNRHLHSVLLR